MESVKKIELIFENCEWLDVTNAIGDFSIENVSTEIRRVASNCIGKVINADFIRFQIFGDGEFKSGLFSSMTPCERIFAYNDITGIEIAYENGTKETIHPDFNGEYENEYQASVEYNGDIFVVISKDKTLSSVYTNEIMEQCIASKDFCMNPEVKAMNSLKAEGWKEVFKTENFMQIYKDRQSIVFSKDYTNLAFFYPYQSYLIDNKTMENICSLVFNLCFCNHALKTENFSDYGNLLIDKEATFTKEKSGNVVVPFSFYCKSTNKRVEARLTFNRNKKLRKEVHEGYIEIDSYKLTTKEVYNFLWLLHKFIY